MEEQPSPDLSGKPHVVFIEAKPSRYCESFVPNDEGFLHPKFEDVTHAKLALIHRCKYALLNWDGQVPASITEPEALFQAYARSFPEGGLNDKSSSPRQLCRGSVVQKFAKLGLHGLQLEHFHLVAMTAGPEPLWDHESVLLP